MFTHIFPPADMSGQYTGKDMFCNVLLALFVKIVHILICAGNIKIL